MNNPALHHKSHRDCKLCMGEIIKEYSPQLQWRPDGGDVLLDVGTGPGDVTMNYIYPLLPPNFGRIVFSDISADMLDYAKGYYGTPDKAEYKVLDIATKERLPTELTGQFDHVTSMLVLHWVQDHRKSLENVFNLLRPEGGDCLIVFMSTNSLCAVYDQMKNSKWSEYIKDADSAISPLHHSKDPRGEFAKMMEEVGFSNVNVDFKHKTFQYDSVEAMKEEMKSVCATLADIPTSCHSEFMEDFAVLMSKYIAPSSDLLVPEYSCDLVVAYGQRAPKKENGIVLQPLKLCDSHNISIITFQRV